MQKRELIDREALIKCHLSSRGKGPSSSDKVTLASSDKRGPGAALSTVRAGIDPAARLIILHNYEIGFAFLILLGGIGPEAIMRGKCCGGACWSSLGESEAFREKQPLSKGSSAQQSRDKETMGAQEQ